MPTDYITILDGSGMSVRVLAEDMGSTTWIQAMKACYGPVGVCNPVDKPTPMPILMGLQTTSDFSEILFTISTVGDNNIIAGVAGKVIYVWGFMLQNHSAGQQIVNFRSGGTDISPTAILPLYTWWEKNPMGRSWWQTPASQGLDISLINATGVGGKIWYTQE